MVNQRESLFEAEISSFFLNKTDNINELLSIVKAPDSTGESFPKRKSTRKWCFKFWPMFSNSIKDIRVQQSNPEGKRREIFLRF